MNWDLERLQSLLRDFPWFRTAHADVNGRIAKALVNLGPADDLPDDPCSLTPSTLTFSHGNRATLLD